MTMKLDDFIGFINTKTGMALAAEQAQEDLTNLPEWDSLTFVYLLMEIEKQQDVKIDVEKVLQCTTLNDIYRVVSHEVAESF
ncbi:phosphopantetheine-binding protein [Dickeya dadantii]|uniref:phosphopantetheine-binding protein n=1 Tax=Dickeya dadantii TaxID=204038 RepID=UPI001F3C128B|nr:phosphopantetheine-binding protein [Dickeya dadantii]